MDFLSGHYLLIKSLHVLTALLSITLFFARFLLLMLRPDGPAQRWTRLLPHLNDTLLLIFAGLLCITIQQAPLVTPWLSEKVVAVILYIFAGMFALKWAKSRLAQMIWFMIALSMFAYTATIALNKTPLVL